MKRKLAPSMMCADIFSLTETLACFEKADIELLHIDIMDGAFVPNFTLGTDYVKQLKKRTSIPLDLHFMTEYPERHLDAFPIGKGDYVSIHYESTKHLQRVLESVKTKGARVLLALNPATPVECAMDVLDDVDGLLIMSVNPGFAGQKMVPHTLEKLRRARAFLDANGRPDAEIQVDGNVTFEHAAGMSAAGANILVLGSTLFGSRDMSAAIHQYRTVI